MTVDQGHNTGNIRQEWIDERKHMEDVVCRRFHFLILFFSAVIGGALAAKHPFDRLLILWLGTVITALVALTVRRAHWRLQVNMSHIYENFKDHPATEVKDRIKNSLRGLRCCCGSLCVIRFVNFLKGGYSVNSIIGTWLPLFCFLVLLVLAILASCNVLPLPRTST